MKTYNIVNNLNISYNELGLLEKLSIKVSETKNNYNYNDNDSAPNSGDIYRYPHNPCYSYNAGNTVIRNHHG